MHQNMDIATRLIRIRGRIHELAAPRAVGLIAVSKRQPVAAIEQAYQAGLRHFGENRLQELIDKAPRLPADIEWHFVGRLQRNKVRPAVQLADWIHSVDSLDLLRRIDRIAGQEQRRPRVLLQVNVSGEESKGGVAPADCLELAQAAVECPNLICVGLMTMAPYQADESELRRIFGGLRRLRETLSESLPDSGLSELSMGMSNDYETAISEGATLVRIGTAVFGSRL